MQNTFPSSYRCLALRLTLAVLLVGASRGGMAAEQSVEPTDATLFMGAGAAVGSRNSGAAQHAAAPVLLLDYSTAGGFFASTLRGVGYGGQINGFSYSAAIGYRAERTQKDQRFAFGSSGGQLYGQGQERESLAVSAGFADSKYAQTYYGVSAAQAASAHFKAYQAGAGMYETAMVLTWAHKLNAQWGWTAMLGATQLVKDASRSPLAERKTTPTAAAYVTYNY